MSEFGPIFRESFVSFTLDPWYNIENSVFGFPKGSNFLNFVLHGARLSALQEGYFDRSVPGNVTNKLTLLEVLIFFFCRTIWTNIFHLDVCKDIDKSTNYSLIHVFEVLFNDSSINMMDQEYLVIKSNRSIVYQVLFLLVLERYNLYFFRPWMQIGWNNSSSSSVSEITSEIENQKSIFVLFKTSTHFHLSEK